MSDLLLKQNKQNKQNGKMGGHIINLCENVGILPNNIITINNKLYCSYYGAKIVEVDENGIPL